MNLPKPTLEQAEILKDKSRCKLVVAVPGSGKTTLLFQLIQKHVRRRNGRYLLVSFTKRVEEENQDKVEKYFPSFKDRIKVQTFDSFCNRVIRDNWKVAGYSLMPEFDGEFDDALFANAYAEVEDEDGKLSVTCVDAKEVVKYAYAKQTNYKRSCKKLDISITPKQLKTIRIVSKRYSKLRRKQGKFSHNEVVRECLRLFTLYPDILAKTANQYSLLLVDELQDLSDNQLKIATLIAQHTSKSIFVGDDAQTIYDFRGVREDNIQALQSSLQGTLFTLALSHRCTKQISALATQLRFRIKNVTPIEMQSNTEGELPLLLGFKNKHKQYAEVAKQIVALREQGANYADIAIIARLHESLAQVQRELQLHAISFNTKFTQEYDVKVHYQILTAFIRVIIIGFDKESLDSIFLFLNIESTQSNFEYIESELNSDNKNERYNTDRNLKSLGHLIHEVSICSSLSSKVQCIRNFISKQYAKHNKHYLASHLLYATDQAKVINDAEALIHSINGLQVEDGSSVSLLTTHASKGLEFDHVFVIDADDSRFPFKRSKKNYDKFNAEKKKLYVAITRSLKTLVITSLNNQDHKPTKFITTIKGLKSLITMRMNNKMF